MTYLYTGTSQLASTNTGLSTQIVIKVDGQAVGSLVSFQVSENRPIKTITEIGTDGIIEKVPSGPTEVKIQVQRMVFDRKRMTEAFQRAYLNIHAQRIPFDIFVYDFSNVDPATVDADFDASSQNGVITTIFENCWWESKSYTYTSGDYTIQENAGLVCEFVHSYINGDPKANASSGNPDFDDPVERLVDTSRRGSLDARGLAKVNDIFGVFQG